MHFIHQNQVSFNNIPSDLTFLGINTLPTWESQSNGGSSWSVTQSKYSELITIMIPVQSGLFNTQ